MREQDLLTAKPQAAEDASNPVAVYDRVTKAWQLLLGDDLHFGYFEDPQVPLSVATARLTREMAEWAQLRAETRVLDVGCGIGGPAQFLAFRGGCLVTGISTSRVGVQLAASRAEAQGLRGRVEFFERDGMANGFPAESFDCAWIMESSHLMERKDLLLAESARVLRPEGLLVVCDIVVRKTIPFQYLVRNLAEFENLNAVFGKQHVELLSTYRQVAEKCGLTVLRAEDISEAVLPTLEHWRGNAELNRDELRELIGEEYLGQFLRACGFLQLLWKEEKLGYGIMLARKPA
jgi:cyclopropane fatty-acyl-phospholipid synthase-like methyltransferase